jgi:hypothetical protein
MNCVDIVMRFCADISSWPCRGMKAIKGLGSLPWDVQKLGPDCKHSRVNCWVDIDMKGSW